MMPIIKYLKSCDFKNGKGNKTKFLKHLLSKYACELIWSGRCQGHLDNQSFTRNAAACQNYNWIELWSELAVSRGVWGRY